MNQNLKLLLKKIHLFLPSSNPGTTNKITKHIESAQTLFLFCPNSKKHVCLSFVSTKDVHYAVERMNFPKLLMRSKVELRHYVIFLKLLEEIYDVMENGILENMNSAHKSNEFWKAIGVENYKRVPALRKDIAYWTEFHDAGNVDLSTFEHNRFSTKLYKIQNHSFLHGKYLLC